MDSGMKKFRVLFDTGNVGLSLPSSLKDSFIKVIPKSARSKCVTVKEQGLKNYQILVCLDLTMT
jgi:hypothetical protein